VNLASQHASILWIIYSKKKDFSPYAIYQRLNLLF
jgi:hypothetical protein